MAKSLKELLDAAREAAPHAAMVFATDEKLRAAVEAWATETKIVTRLEIELQHVAFEYAEATDLLFETIEASTMPRAVCDMFWGLLAGVEWVDSKMPRDFLAVVEGMATNDDGP